MLNQLYACLVGPFFDIHHYSNAMDTIFSPPQSSQVSEEIATQIEAAVMGGKFAPGDRLPSERDLQKYFQSGRGAIREALSALRQKGLVEIRKGAKGGAYVKEVDVTEASESLALLIKQRKIPLEYLIEFREAIDRAVTTLALTRAKDEEHQLLEKLCEDLTEATGQEPPDMDRVIEIDRQLNLAFVKMTRNPIFEWVMRTIQLGFGSYDYVLYEDPYYRAKTVTNWRETAKQIADGELLKALSFIGYHYLLLNRYIKERAASPSSDEKFHIGTEIMELAPQAMDNAQPLTEE